MTVVSQLLSDLAIAARENRKADFDRLERELLAHFDGSFDGMPEEVYDRYLEVDRLWPVAAQAAQVPGGGAEVSERRHAVRVSLAVSDDAWLRHLGTGADRSLSAVLGACIRLIRGDEQLERRIVEALQQRLERD
jgi:hypothetical protein